MKRLLMLTLHITTSFVQLQIRRCCMKITLRSKVDNFTLNKDNATSYSQQPEKNCNNNFYFL